MAWHAPPESKQPAQQTPPPQTPGAPPPVVQAVPFLLVLSWWQPSAPQESTMHELFERQSRQAPPPASAHAATVLPGWQVASGATQPVQQTPLVHTPAAPPELQD